MTKDQANIILFANDEIGSFSIDLLLSKFPNSIRAIVVLEPDQRKKLNGVSAEKILLFDTEEKLIEELKPLIDRFTVTLLAWWPLILSERLLTTLNLRVVNTHPSYLPFNRGKNPSFWAVIDQRPFGVSLHLVDPEIDHGPVIARQIIGYDLTDTGRELYDRSIEEMKKLLITYIERILYWKFSLLSDECSVETIRLASDIDTASKIDLNKFYKAIDLITLIKARNYGDEYPACWFEFNGTKYEVRAKVKKL